MPATLWPAVVYAVILVLHLVVPARHVAGYVRDPLTGEPLRYRLNGARVLVVTVGLYVAVGAAGWLPWDLFWTHRYAMAAGAAALGLVFTLAVVLPAPRRGSLLADLYLGRLDNPRWGGVDLKMVLYLAGAILLELNVLAAAAHHLMTHASPNPGVLLFAAMMSFFVVDYLLFEEVHLYTYDLFAERVGFKLGWGCLAFYPYFYAVGLWTTADLPAPGTPPAALAACVAVFLAGWVLSRGANLQKFLFKTRPESRLLGLAPVAIEGRLLCSGFWGLARHINYLGEILMAVGLALVLGYPAAIGPWLYPLYYLLLLLPRERADDRRCAAKYGPLWDEYRRRVPRRIVPGVY